MSDLKSISDLIETVHRLRAPNGCPWDRAQTHQSLRPYLIEESYEVLDILDQIKSVEDLKLKKISEPFREELGDLLMQVLLHSEMTAEAGAFNFTDVAETLNEKLIRRHPHVFGNEKEDSPENAVKRWEKEKVKEKKGKPNSSVLDGVPRGLPTLQRSTRVIEKVTRVGFQWNDMEGPLKKVEEELQELKVEVLELEKLNQNKHPSENADKIKKRIEEELGDLLFTLSNLAHLNQINPEDALRGTLSRFEKRFRHVENRLKWQGKSPEQSNLEEMDHYWNEAKKLEKIKLWGLTGGIASGKSTVGTYFSELGIPVIDADAISRGLSEKGGAAYPELMKRFGTADRNLLRETVFSNPEAKQDLENILHPLIQKKSIEEILTLSNKHNFIIYEAALLVETGRYRDLDGIITVEAPEELRLERLLSRNQMPLETAHKILSSQCSDLERRSFALFILENSGSLPDLKQKVQELITSQRWI